MDKFNSSISAKLFGYGSSGFLQLFFFEFRTLDYFPKCQPITVVETSIFEVFYFGFLGGILISSLAKLYEYTVFSSAGWMHVQLG